MWRCTSEAKLRALGLWDHPLVARHHEAITAGRTIVEALREGTMMNGVAHFLNIDDLAILRPKPEAIAQAEVVRAVQLAFSHVGKQCNFRFDNNTWDSVVCSELAFQTYVDVRWSVGRMLTSYTIAPDDVAIFEGSDPSRPFELVRFIHDGRSGPRSGDRSDGGGRYPLSGRQRDFWPLCAGLRSPSPRVGFPVHRAARVAEGG